MKNLQVKNIPKTNKKLKKYQLKPLQKEKHLFHTMTGYGPPGTGAVIGIENETGRSKTIMVRKTDAQTFLFIPTRPGFTKKEREKRVTINAPNYPSAINAFLIANRIKHPIWKKKPYE